MITTENATYVAKILELTVAVTFVTKMMDSQHLFIRSFFSSGSYSTQADIVNVV